MNFLQFYSDFLCNIFIFLAYDLFISNYSVCISKEKKYIVKALFFLLWTICSFIPSIPYFTYTSKIVDIIYILLISKSKLIKNVVIFLCFNVYKFLSTVIIVLLHTFATRDLLIYTSNDIYAKYTDIIVYFLIYVTLCMYIILKKLSDFPTGKVYKRYFLAVTSIMVILLTVCSMFLGSSILDQEDTVPLFFLLLLIISFLSLSIYRKVVFVLEENMLAKIEAEKNIMEKDYAIQVEENLKKLSILRHDFKNHLIILRGYAENDRKEELLEYMQSLTDEFSTTTLVNTPSQLLSSLINAKKADCDQAKVAFDFQWDFSSINITDFALVTIISNLLDNALTAASKCKDGFIELKIYEQRSYLEIDCLNNHHEIIKKEGNYFVTTKEDRPEIHGLGLISVSKTVNNLRGEIKVEYSDDRFHVNIIVPNYI